MVANSTRTRKTKGQEFQKEIVMALRERFKIDTDIESCFEGDIQANPMGNSGRDIKLSPLVETIIPFDIEAKRVERLDIWKSLLQAEGNASAGRIPLLVFRKNRSKVYACIEFETLLWITGN